MVPPNSLMKNDLTVEKSWYSLQRQQERKKKNAALQDGRGRQKSQPVVHTSIGSSLTNIPAKKIAVGKSFYPRNPDNNYSPFYQIIAGSRWSFFVTATGRQDALFTVNSPYRDGTDSRRVSGTVFFSLFAVCWM